MALTVKQLEELDLLNNNNIEQFDDISDVSSEKEEVDEATAGALACRRQVLERAIEYANQIKHTALNSINNYKTGMLVYDNINRKYARVAESSLEKVHLKYVSGGEAFLVGSVISVNGITNNTLQKDFVNTSNAISNLLSVSVNNKENNKHNKINVFQKDIVKPNQPKIKIKKSNLKLKLTKNSQDCFKNNSCDHFAKSLGCELKQTNPDIPRSGILWFNSYSGILYSIFLSAVVVFFNSNSNRIFGLSVFPKLASQTITLNSGYILFFVPKYNNSLKLALQLTKSAKLNMNNDKFFSHNTFEEITSNILNHRVNTKKILSYVNKIERSTAAKIDSLKQKMKKKSNKFA